MIVIASVETTSSTTPTAPVPPTESIHSFNQIIDLPKWWASLDIHTIVVSVIHASIWLLVSSIVLIVLCRILVPIFHKHMAQPAAALLIKLIKLTGWSIIVVETFALLGFDIITLLGAASIIGVAVGFASQTSLSNIISGLFLVGERQINIGDIIEIEGVRGTVDAINLMAVQLRLPDNTMVRIPNELIIKNPVSNATRFETRRCDISISVDYDSDLDTVLSVVNKILKEHPLCLDSPAPSILFDGFQDSGIGFIIGAWCQCDDYVQLRLDLAKQIKKEFDQVGISIPYPIVSVDARNGSIPITSKNESQSDSPVKS